MFQVSEDFLKSSGIQSYFLEIVKNLVHASVNHWYAKLEINFLYTTLCLCSQLQVYLFCILVKSNNLMLDTIDF